MPPRPITRDEVISELAKAIVAAQESQPDPTEGWQSMADLMRDLQLSEPAVRRRLRKMNLERKMWRGFMYYRLRNGKP